VSVSLSVLNKTIFMKFNLLGFFEWVLRNFSLNRTLRRIVGTDRER